MNGEKMMSKALRCEYCGKFTKLEDLVQKPRPPISDYSLDPPEIDGCLLVCTSCDRNDGNGS